MTASLFLRQLSYVFWTYGHISRQQCINHSFFYRSAISHQSFALLRSLQVLIIWESCRFDRVCLSKTCLFRNGSTSCSNFLRFLPLKCIYLRRVPLVAGFSKYVARWALQTCLRGRFGPLLVPPSCLWGEKSNKCNQLVCAFFHNYKRLVKKHAAGGKMRGALQNWLVGRFQPGQQSACGWWGVCPIVPDVPSSALLLLLFSPQLAHKTGAHCYSQWPSG